jgi:hypothetical protein
VRAKRLEIANKIARKRWAGVPEWQRPFIGGPGRLRKWNGTFVYKSDGYNKPRLRFLRFKQYRRNGEGFADEVLAL